ncbi:hypothetical protein XA68_12462 [Ophiocordyceps unilateralis]|uniref:Uncharacterized protein n=1 Tax=Ophiocordyceps unilateralis TaxID=268505 RepID=A0A2A9PER1_OPHUN|nr:hypothetical protein XA68_12462 [Ophiocordyceps unilateralis]
MRMELSRRTVSSPLLGRNVAERVFVDDGVESVACLGPAAAADTTRTACGASGRPGWQWRRVRGGGGWTGGARGNAADRGLTARAHLLEVAAELLVLFL